MTPTTANSRSEDHKDWKSIALSLENRVSVLEMVNSMLLASISWLQPPFIDERTSEGELRTRIGFTIVDARRAREALSPPLMEMKTDSCRAVTVSVPATTETPIGNAASLTKSERHELECLRHQVGQLEYPCSPHCEGYLRELARRNGGSRP